jgi:hypothetical protein
MNQPSTFLAQGSRQELQHTSLAWQVPLQTRATVKTKQFHCSCFDIFTLVSWKEVKSSGAGTNCGRQLPYKFPLHLRHEILILCSKPIFLSTAYSTRHQQNLDTANLEGIAYLSLQTNTPTHLWVRGAEPEYWTSLIPKHAIRRDPTSTATMTSLIVSVYLNSNQSSCFRVDQQQWRTFRYRNIAPLYDRKGRNEFPPLLKKNTCIFLNYYFVLYRICTSHLLKC